MAGVEGIEPPLVWFRARCSPIVLHPNGGLGGIRTHNDRSRLVYSQVHCLRASNPRFLGASQPLYSLSVTV